MKRIDLKRLSIIIINCAIACLLLLLDISCVNLSSNREQNNSPFQADPMNLKDVKVMAWQDENYLWLGNRAGVARINRIADNVEVFDDVACPLLFITSISKNIWCSTVNYVNKYDGEIWHRYDVTVRKIIEAQDGTVWAGTKQGLSFFDSTNQRWQEVIKSSQIASHFTFSDGGGINLSFQAKDKSFWFSSYSEPYVGTTRWTPTSKQTWQPTGKWSVVHPVLEAKDGSIWGIADEGIIARWDTQEWKIWQPFHLKPSIRDLIEAHDGSIWVLGVVDGVGQWDGQSWQIWSRDKYFLQDCPGTLEEHECFSVESNVRYRLANGLGKLNLSHSRLELTTLIETHDGYIWVGTAEEGISRWNGNEWRNYTKADGLSSEAVTALTESSDGILWAGTLGGGINFYNTKADRWQPFP